MLGRELDWTTIKHPWCGIYTDFLTSLGRVLADNSAGMSQKLKDVFRSLGVERYFCLLENVQALLSVKMRPLFLYVLQDLLRFNRLQGHRAWAVAC